MKHQRGITLGGMLFFMVLIGFGVYTAARVLPAYMDYWVIKKIMRNVLDQPDLLQIAERDLRMKFTKELSLNNVKVVTPDDLEIEQVPGGLRLSTHFSVKEPFMGPVSLCLDFQAEASSK
jgi:Tfp pilus assembly protein PilX